METSDILRKIGGHVVFAESQSGAFRTVIPQSILRITHYAIRDCNPGLEFSIPGYGIVEFPIPGSRRDCRSIIKTTKIAKWVRYLDRYFWTTSVYDRATDLVLMCCKRYSNILLHLLLSMCRYVVDRSRANRPLTFKSRARSKVTSLIDRLKCTCDVTIQVPTDSCISVTTVMDVSQLYRGVYVTTCGHVGSVELWVINVVKPTGSYWGDSWARKVVDLKRHMRRHKLPQYDPVGQGGLRTCVCAGVNGFTNTIYLLFEFQPILTICTDSQ